MRAFHYIVLLAVALPNNVSAAVFCRTDSEEPAQIKHVKAGNTYLHKLDADGASAPVNDAGRCAQVACSYNTAILWCNDSPKKIKELPNYGVIADSAQIILDECEKDGEHTIAGTETHDDGWSGRIMHTPCYYAHALLE